MRDEMAQTRETRISLLFPRSSTHTSVNRTGSWSYMRPRYLEKTAPCSVRCPCGQDIPRIEMLAARGRIEAAWQTILAENPLPGSCGRVCFHPCEEGCNRAEFDEAVSINALERYLDDAAREGAFSESAVPMALPPKGRRIAIVGSGPAGLSAAYFLAKLGYECEIFEAGQAAGGVLRSGIPSYRLPNEILDREIRRIEALGVRLRCGEAVGPEFLASARDKGHFDAVFIACGHGKPAKLGIPGEELAVDGLAFLNRSKNGAQALAGQLTGGSRDRAAETAIVIGGGNSAIDVARSLLRATIAPTIVYRRRREDMPAFRHEIERALDEGVRIVELQAPLSIERKDSGIELTLQPMRTSEIGSDGRMRVVALQSQTEKMVAGAIYIAAGASVAESWMLPPASGELLRMSHCATWWNSSSGLPLLYGGDPVNEEESVADAIASGKQAAIALDVFFGKGASEVEAAIARCSLGDGHALSMEAYLGGMRGDRSRRVIRIGDINVDYFSPSAKERGSLLPITSSRASFDEIESAMDAAQAAAQAGRCFNCGICNDCDNCRTYCPEAAVFAARARKGGDWSAEAGADREVNADWCKGCGICVTECPRGAMIIEEQQS